MTALRPASHADDVDHAGELCRGERLGRDFFARDVLEVAPDLLNKVLVVSNPSDPNGGVVAIRLSEVEAYGGIGTDPGSHAHRSRTPRNSVMFGRGGLLYVYRSYGLHWCVNIVTGQEETAAAVLLRAGEVISGAAAARQRRSRTAASVAERDLARGPGRLCAAVGIDGSHNALTVLDRSPIGLFDGGFGVESDRIAVSTRTGVSGPGAALPYRFFLPGDPTVSPHRPAPLREREPQGRTALNSRNDR